MASGSVKRDDAGWMFVVDVPGPSGSRKQVRRRGFATKKEAQEELTRLRGDVQRGTFVKRTKMTLGEYLHTWLDGLPAAGRRPSTVAGYRQVLEYNVIPVLGAIELQAVKATHLDALYAQLLGRGLAMSTVRKIHVVVGKALADAVRKDITSRNVARLATPPAASASKAPEMKYWTPIQLRTFLAGIEGHHHYPVIRTAAMTGLRRGELCGLRWVDVDLDARTVSVRHTVISVCGKPVHGDVKTSRVAPCCRPRSNHGSGSEGLAQDSARAADAGGRRIDRDRTRFHDAERRRLASELDLTSIRSIGQPRQKGNTGGTRPASAASPLPRLEAHACHPTPRRRRQHQGRE